MGSNQYKPLRGNNWNTCCESKPTGYLQDLGPQHMKNINKVKYRPGEDRGDFFQGGYHG